jgi:hypothetical protein
MRYVSDKSCTENQNTHSVFSNFFLLSKILQFNVEKYCGAGQTADGSILRHMGCAYWIPKATNTQSGCLIIVAFPLQQWLYEGTPTLRYMYPACLVILSIRGNA